MSLKPSTKLSDLPASESNEHQVHPASPISSNSISMIQDTSLTSGAIGSLDDMRCKKSPTNKLSTCFDGSLEAGNFRQILMELDECGRRVESRGECCHRLDGGRQLVEFGLLYNSRERLKLKDFSAEVRASMDVEQFVHQAELILDMKEVSVDGIVERMVTMAISSERGPDDRMDQVKEHIFVPGSPMILSQTIQGMGYLAECNAGWPSGDSSLHYDQSWLCAMCSVAQISRRHIVIARFKQATNMGENAHEVKLFALIVTPIKEKGTKNALETGRTFATMLTDYNFRQQLLEAKTETEFKSLMMLRAHHLSKAKTLKNRHKYSIGPAVHHSMTSLNAAEQEAEEMRQESAKVVSNKSPEIEAIKLDLVVEKGDANNNAANGAMPNRALAFGKNTHTSKLFELIAQASPADLEGSDSAGFDFTRGRTVMHNRAGKEQEASCCGSLEFGKGLWSDFCRRLSYYPSDFKDAVVGPPKTIQKTVATTWFLYFGILLPTIAFSALNTTQTHGHMGDLRKAIIGQAIGGLGFALFGGQPLVIIMTTAPLCLYTKVIHQMCIDYGFHFPAMYAAVGLWNGFFLIIYSLFGFSRLMKWCTRSTEEIFALFIVVAFITDAGKDLMKNFNKFYYTPACEALDVTLGNNGTVLQMINGTNTILEAPACRRETSLLFVLLMLGTRIYRYPNLIWLAMTLYRFNRTPYLQAGKRELLADYALPTAVIAMSFVGSYVFEEIYVESFPPLKSIHLERAQVELLSTSGILTSLGLGFTLSLLFFMDQNISAAMVNAPQHRLKKGCAYHYDLLVVGILNGFLALYGFPMMHGVLPHSPLHVRSLADIEERKEEGHLREVITNVRETRVTGIVSHILVLATLLLIPYPIAYIPTAVLNGLFLYMAVTSLDGLQLFERILLLFTEQSKYPPNHYIRRAPQRKVHLFTLLQLIQLFILVIFGFSPSNIVEMFFPVIIMLMIPFRHKIVTKCIDEKYLDALDGKH